MQQQTFLDSTPAVDPAPIDANAPAQTAPDWALLRATLPFRRAFPGRSLWQVASTLLLFVACCTLVALHPAWWMKLLLVLPLAGLLVRVFVLQHDCGHGSLFNSPRANSIVGHLLACITTVPFRLWAAEHHWHHNNQGKLEHRGVDLMNSPLTLDEAAADEPGRRYRENKITPFNIFCIGAWSLLVERKFTRDFFLFRKAFRWPVPNERKLRRSIWFAHAGSIAAHGTLLFALGWVHYLSFIVPASFLAAGCGSLLFWVQHNFEDTYFDRLSDWRFDKVGTQGSSYLKLPQPLRWFTADIGLHHVHHLNAHIPNYRLEEARRALPVLAAVRPLTRDQLRATFYKLFWDVKRRKMAAWPGLPH
ncbi:MAG TPA: fatty acid desaturase [Pseudomonadales bacterium]